MISSSMAKRRIYKTRFVVLFVLFLLSVGGVIFGVGLTDGIKGLVLQKKEAERPANIDAVLIGTPECSQCQQVISSYLRDIPQRINIVYSSQEEVDPQTNEARKLIDKYGITKLPALILTGEIDKDDQVKNFLTTLGQKKPGAVVISGIAPPYQSLEAKEIVGEFKLIFLTDKACANCYDVNIHKNILPSIGLFPFEEESIDKDSVAGRQLVQRYAIKKVPTILLEGDLEVYSRLGQIWENVGRVADDGTYIFEAVEQLGTYRDLSQGKIVEVKTQNQQSVHDHVNFLVFIDGEQFDFAREPNRYFVKDQKAHIEDSNIEGAAGKVIHVHAQGITMRKFLDTLGWRLTDTCLTTAQDGRPCSDGKRSLKVYRNGEIDNTFGSQELQNNDKYLLSFGSQDDSVLEGQIKKVPDYAY